MLKVQILVSEINTHFHACQLSTTNSVKQHKLRKLITWLSGKEGRGREFLSLYIPQGKATDEIVAFLKEKSDSEVMKSDSAGRRLQDALKNITQHLKQKEEIPENGVAVFAGTFAAKTGESEGLNVEELVPPEPITTYSYDVDDHFHLEPLREMLRNQKLVGLIALDSKEASFGVLNGERYEFIETITSGIHGKSGKGGSSQRRYERERDMAVTQFFHRVAEHAAKSFLEKYEVTVLIVGGPGTTKEDFLNGDFLHYELKDALVSKVDTQSAGMDGVREVLDKSCDLLKNMCAPEERRVVQRLLESMGKDNGLSVYGLDAVLNALKNGEAETALVTDSTNIEVEGKDIVDVLEDLATQTNARVEVISTDSEEKAKLTALGGVAVLLRYKP
jgi:peptide chain release factor subunit 1